jgi:hypothetical protein
MTKMVLLKNIQDNPYRDKKRNPIDPTRIEQLVESIGTTGFWKGVYGRECGESVEIAFGSSTRIGRRLWRALHPQHCTHAHYGILRIDRC